MSRPATAGTATVDDLYCTDDLALVAVLRLHGHRAQDLVREIEGASWRFLRTETLMAVVEQYQDKTVQVEPRDYVRALAACRNQLYRFMERQG